MERREARALLAADSQGRTAPGDVDRHHGHRQYPRVGTLRRVIANLPGDLVDEAMRVSGKNVTATLEEGLRLVKRSRAYDKAMRLKGRVGLEIDVDRSRERRRR